MDFNSKPETVTEALARWDAGELLWSVEMGGLGPGYEQAIQVAAVEICRRLNGPFALPTDREVLSAAFDLALDQAIRAEPVLGGLSGAMAGAAKSLAAQFLHNGWRGALEKFEAQCPDQRDRLIQIRKSFP